MRLIKNVNGYYDVFDKFETYRGVVSKAKGQGWQVHNDQGTLVAKGCDTKESAAYFISD